MATAKIAYVRVSSKDQNTDRQLATFRERGLELDKIFSEKQSGKDAHRPELLRMIEYVREGDELYITSLDRLARNLDDLRRLVDQITAKGCAIHFLRENLNFSNRDSEPMSKLMLSVLGAFAEFERSIIKERQAEGIAAARSKGRQLGRKPKLTRDQAEQIAALVRQGMPVIRVARQFGVNRNTVYRYLDANKQK